MKKLASLVCALLMMAGAYAAQAAQLKTYDLTINSYDTTFYEADNDVFMILYTEDYEATIRLDIKVEEGRRFFTNGKTYTWDDMIHKFCNAYVKDEYREYPFADASFTWHLDELGLEHFAGTATDSVGNIYNFHYDVLPYSPTGDTIEITFTEPLKMEHSSNWYFSGTQGEYYILMTLINEGESPVGHYTEENIDLTFSYIDISLGGGDFEMYLFHHATIDITEAADDTLRIEALIAAQDTNVYHFHMFYVAPKPLNKVDITATDMYINTDYLYGMVGAIQVVASNDTYALKFAFSPMNEDLNIYDTYYLSNVSPNIGYLIDDSDPDTPIEVYEGTVTLALTYNGPVLTGTVLCYNNTEYTLNLSYAVPEKTRDEQMVADGLLLQASSAGAWRISGYNADSTQFISLVLNGFGIAGDYSFVEVSRDYSYVVTDIVWNGGDVISYQYFDVIDVDLTAELQEPDSIVTVTGTVLGQQFTDIPQFTVSLSNKPAQKEAVDRVPFAATAAKRFRDGMLIIEKNGIKYDVLGNVVR
jgi:hypothetical protein